MRARRVDANHGEIIAAFRRLGYSVVDLSRLGNGIPDLLIAKAGHAALVEIKDGAKSPSRRKLTLFEKAFRDRWSGAYHVVETLDDVQRIVSHWTNTQ